MLFVALACALCFLWSIADSNRSPQHCFYSINKAWSLPAGFIVEAKSQLASSHSSQMS